MLLNLKKGWSQSPELSPMLRLVVPVTGSLPSWPASPARDLAEQDVVGYQLSLRRLICREDATVAWSGCQIPDKGVGRMSIKLHCSEVP